MIRKGEYTRVFFFCGGVLSTVFSVRSVGYTSLFDNGTDHEKTSLLLLVLSIVDSASVNALFLSVVQKSNEIHNNNLDHVIIAF